MREIIENVLDTDDITTMKKGRYTDKERVCCYELLALNVGVDKVQPIINSVLKKLCT